MQILLIYFSTILSDGGRSGVISLGAEQPVDCDGEGERHGENCCPANDTGRDGLYQAAV